MINPKFSVAKIIDLCCITLIVLVFLSKLSFKWMQIIPYSVPPIIFQYGLHPFINFGLQTVVTLILIFYWLKKKPLYPLSQLYRIFIYTLISILSIQTLFQITLVNVTQSVIVQLGGLGMAIMLILVYGVIVPSIFPLEKFVNWINKVSSFLVISSFIFLPLCYPYMFRGGRFVGFFKHIPHMVTASTASFIFFFPRIFQDKPWTLKNNTILKILGLFIITLCVLLTSTKAAFATIVITGFVGILIYGSKKRSIRLFKFTFLSCFLISVLLVGAPTSQFMYEVTTGKTGFGLRPAQDGVSTRMDEVFRGWTMFEQSPYFGHGLLYKFFHGDKEGIEVEGYNSFKDPHNLFISAGVIGGYPLLILSIFGYVLMIAGVLKGLNEDNVHRQTMALFLLAHLPVFIIYHANFSLGGMGDRIYWLVFGYLGQSWGLSSKKLT
ncbi:MAG: O-antigen ligase family protein [Bdellovibrionales bacterium]|nr:O-antigen ligase family protein [Bdellovibrionales bacterium]